MITKTTTNKTKQANYLKHVTSIISNKHSIQILLCLPHA